MLDRCVLVDVADDTQRLELPHLVGAGDRPAEDDDARVDGRACEWRGEA